MTRLYSSVIFPNSSISALLGLSLLNFLAAVSIWIDDWNTVSKILSNSEVSLVYIKVVYFSCSCDFYYSSLSALTQVDQYIAYQSWSKEDIESIWKYELKSRNKMK